MKIYFYQKMTTKQIRFTANEEMLSALSELKQKFKLLSEVDILKLALSKFYTQELGYDENGFSPEFQKELDTAIADIEKEKNLEGPFNSVDDFFDTI